MTLFTVQAPGLDDEGLARARFVGDRFSRPAFVFAWAWLLYQRLWLAFVVWVAAEIAFLVLVLPHVSLLAALLVDLLARVFLGLEGHRLRLAKGARRAVLTELVEARDGDEAEAIFYSRHGQIEMSAPAAA